MGWLGKIIGGGVGFLIGGPIGAAIGATAGHYGYDGEQKLSREEELQIAYFYSLFSCLAKMAKADGVVSQSEINVMDNFITNALGWDSDARQFAIGVFRRAKNDDTPVEEYLSQFARISNYDLEIGRIFLGTLYEVAMADGTLHPEELKILRSAESYLRLPAGTVDSLLGYSNKSISEYYSILGCSPEMTDEEIKSAYRAQCKKFHSDHLQSKGLPEEFIQFANSQLILVKEAYDAISQYRSSLK